MKNSKPSKKGEDFWDDSPKNSRRRAPDEQVKASRRTHDDEESSDEDFSDDAVSRRVSNKPSQSAARPRKGDRSGAANRSDRSRKVDQSQNRDNSRLGMIDQDERSIEEEDVDIYSSSSPKKKAPRKLPKAKSQ